MRILHTDPASVGKPVSPSERSGAVGRVVNCGGCRRANRSVTADAIPSVIVPLDIEVIMLEFNKDDDCVPLIDVGIDVIDNGGGPLDRFEIDVLEVDSG